MQLISTAATTGAAGVYLARKYWSDESRLKRYGSKAAAIALMAASGSSIALHFGLRALIRDPEFMLIVLLSAFFGSPSERNLLLGR